MKKRIAILAPLFLPIPPKKQGGTEWIVYHQANGLIRAGFDVTLFAIRGSKTNARLIPIADCGSRDYPFDPRHMESSRILRLENALIARTLTELLDRKNDFDLVFTHIRGGQTILPLTSSLPAPVIHILHLPIFPEIADLYKHYRAPLISISNAQRKGFEHLHFVATVYNGVDLKTFTFNKTPKDYVFSISTIGEHKNVLDAILAAKKTKTPLIIAGKIRDHDYFNEKIKPHLDHHNITYIGEVGLQEKVKLYREAKALLFPIIWQEAFGLVAIEALACGTPVIAYTNGALPEIVEDSTNGYLVDTVEEMETAIQTIDRIDRTTCRRSAEKKFSVEQMVKAYVQVAEQQISANAAPSRTP